MSKKLNKVLSGFLALSMLATPVLSVNAEVVENVPTEETEILYGDINSDGVIDNSDVDILKKAIFGIGSLTESEFLSADLNGDGRLNSFDLAKISKLVKEKRNLRVVEDYDYDKEYSNIFQDCEVHFVFAYGRHEYYVNDYVYGVANGGYELYEIINLDITLNGIRHHIPTALESGLVTVDEIMAVNKRIGPLSYGFNLERDVKVIPPADDVITQPLSKCLYTDGKYDYYFSNLGLYTIEIYSKKYTLYEVIDKEFLTFEELITLGLYDFKEVADLGEIETIEIYDPVDDPYYDGGYEPALQLIYQDEEHNYYLGALIGEYITVTINGVKFSLKEVIQNEILTIHELIDAGLYVHIGEYQEDFIFVL